MKTKLILMLFVGITFASQARPPRGRHLRREIVADHVELNQDQKELQRAKANHNWRRVKQEKMEIRQDKIELAKDKRRKRLR